MNDTIKLSDRLELRPYTCNGDFTFYRDGAAVANVSRMTADALITACNPPRCDLPPGVIAGSDGKFYAPGGVVRTLPDEMWERRYNKVWWPTGHAGAHRDLIYEVRPTAANPLPTLPEHTFPLPDGRLACLRRDAAALRAQGATLHYTDNGQEMPSERERDADGFVCEVRFPPAPKTERVRWHQSYGRTLADGREIHGCKRDGSDLALIRVDGKWTNGPIDFDGTVEVLCLEASR